MNFEFMAHNPLPSFSIESGDFLPFQLRNKVGDWLTFDISLQAEQTRHRLIEVNDAAILVHDQNAVFDGIEKSFKKAPLTGQTLDHVLQTFSVQPRNAP